MSRRKQKLKQFEHQRGLCCWCLKPMIIGGGCDNRTNSATWEHIIPRALGGSDALINLALAHRSCNNKRGSRIGTPHFRSYRLISAKRINPEAVAPVVGMALCE